MKIMKTLAMSLMPMMLTLGSAVAKETAPKVRFNQLPGWLQEDAREAFPEMRHKGEIRQVLDGKVFVWSTSGYSPVLFQQKNGSAYYISSIDAKNDQANQWTKLGILPGKDVSMTKELRVAFYNKAFDEPDFGFQYNKPEKGKTVLLYSAIDCGYCVMLEKALHKAGVPFIVVPTTLSGKPSREFKNVYCASDKPKAWTEMMTKRTYVSAKDPDCDMPYAEFDLLGEVLATGSTPAGLMPDGTVLDGSELWGAYGLKKPK